MKTKNVTEHDAITKKLEEYKRAGQKRYQDELEECKLKHEMDALLKRERRIFLNKIKSVMESARPGWRLESWDMRASIKHNHDPLQYYVYLSITVSMNTDAAHGDVILSGCWGKDDALIEELRSIVASK
jgi:hypothetical protein